MSKIFIHLRSVVHLTLSSSSSVNLRPARVITVPFLQRLSSFSSQVMVFFSVLFFSFSFSYFFFHCSAVSSTFTHTVLFISHHLCPNMSVVLVSASLKEDGEQQITIVVLQFPPRESCKILVILLSL
uniref:Transmembrane protein n=1 Tax=Sinocyclocheilus grahami TaxID=75366 RepID=A0A672NIJ3_SINGR